MSDYPTKNHTEQWQPLHCSACKKSAYDLMVSWAQNADAIEPEMLRKTDPVALDPMVGNIMDCPYCHSPLAIPTIYPVIGGGSIVRFSWLTKAAETS